MKIPRSKSSLVKYGLKSKLTFGKYSGRSLEEVIMSDPTYIAWCLENVEDFCIVEAAMKLWSTYMHYNGEDIRHIDPYEFW